MGNQVYTYVRIENEILADIYNGKYQSGDRLPSENDLAKYFNVARMTVHKALKNLEEKGFIYAKKGSGYYLNRLVNSQYATLKSFRESAEIRNIRTAKKLLVYKQIKARTAEEKGIAQKLLCSPDETFHYFERLRYEGDKVRSYSRTWVPMSRIPRLDVNCLSNSFYDYLEKDLRLVIKDGNCTISVEMSDEKKNEYFSYSESKPLIRIDEITNLDNGLPFEYDISYFDGDQKKVRFYRERKKQQ